MLFYQIKEFYEVCLKLWEDKGVMECYVSTNCLIVLRSEYLTFINRCGHFVMHGSFFSFMNVKKLQTVASPYFTPNNDVCDIYTYVLVVCVFVYVSMYMCVCMHVRMYAWLYRHSLHLINFIC